jgi:hypothetical protein
MLERSKGIQCEDPGSGGEDESLRFVMVDDVRSRFARGGTGAPAGEAWVLNAAAARAWPVSERQKEPHTLGAPPTLRKCPFHTDTEPLPPESTDQPSVTRRDLKPAARFFRAHTAAC